MKYISVYAYEIGKAFKNLNGNIIGRCKKYGVGKLMGTRIYVHKNYASLIIEKEILVKAIKILPKNFKYNCISYDFKIPHKVRFDEALDFDTAREPTPGKMITVDIKNNQYSISRTNQIWHHKWLWVKNDYTEFNVQESYDWSKTWTAKIKDISGIGSKSIWNEKLKKVGLN